MNGVLAKPFTRDGLLKSVRAHLGHLMKNPPSEGDMGSGAGYYSLGGQQQQQPQSQPQYLAQNSVKYESQTPPANGNNWSLEQGYFMNGGQYNISSNPHSMYSNNLSGDNGSGRISDGDSPPEKRQRTGGY